MSTRIKIKVDKSVLEKSKNCGALMCTTNCAVAVAMREIFPTARVNNVAIGYYRNEEDGKGYDFIGISTLPIEARAFINLFDRTPVNERIHLPETEFEINVPDEVIDQIKIKGDLEEIFAQSSTMSLVKA